MRTSRSENWRRHSNPFPNPDERGPASRAPEFGITQLLVVAFALSLCFDFKGEEGGSVWQVVMAGLALACFGAIALASASIRASAAVRRLQAATVAIYVIACLSALLFHAPIDQTIRIAVPYVLFLAGLCVGAWACVSLERLKVLSGAMIVGAFVSLAFRYYYATRVAQFDLAEMRYQLLSPVNATLLAYICAALAFGRRIPWLALLGAAALVLVTALSLTRVYLITLACAACGLAYLIRIIDTRGPLKLQFRSHRRTAVAVALGVAVIALAAASVLRPEVFTNWYGRIFEQRSGISGRDITYVTRIAEVRGIYEELIRSPIAFLTGRGWGNFYFWSLQYVDELRAVYGSTSSTAFRALWTAGHSAFSYALFFGGFGALAWQVYVFWAPLKAALRLSAQVGTATDHVLLRLFLLHALSILLYLSQCFTSNPFGERMAAQFIGLSAGVLLNFGALRSQAYTDQ